jgi:3-hydroxyisobutyrate dehydrogenase-like beta-hydroxyacid dehydrogenase
VARCLIIGCGCRGCLLASELRGGGHAVRGTTRELGRLRAIEAAGAEALLADPDRIATIVPAFEHVSIACVLLGSATGRPDHVCALHGPRLEMLLARMLDTTVRGIVYEAAGSVDPAVLAGGARIVRDACARSRIPYVLLDADPFDHGAWLAAATDAVDRVLDAA